jgi:flagellar biosynthesis/type III secretory pathway M-ring protein FliF/YscJ
MLFLQQGPAETSVYMVAGYAVIFGVMLLYLVSLVVRRRRLAQDLAALEAMEESGAQSSSVV